MGTEMQPWTASNHQQLTVVPLLAGMPMHPMHFKCIQDAALRQHQGFDCGAICS
jgi:hypothetical protein